jgi:integrase
MRWGELVGLRRENIDLEACEVRITETLAQLDKGGLRPDTPKSRAGRRTVAFPAEIAPEIGWHLEQFAEPGERASSSSGRRAAGSAVRTSTGQSGTRRARRSACQASIFTICAIRAAPCRLPRARCSKG